jgi:hypothetical protein
LGVALLLVFKQRWNLMRQRKIEMRGGGGRPKRRSRLDDTDDVFFDFNQEQNVEFE